jgi:Protein of unknown function (DUF3108)
MSRRPILVLSACAAILATGGAFAWLHLRSQQAVVAFTPEAKVEYASPSAPPSSAPTPEKVPSEPVARKLVAEPGFVPQAGEVLEFSAAVAKVNDVANLRLQISDRSDFQGKEAWHFQAYAHTQNPLRMIFPLDDQFDSYSDAGSYASMQYEMRLNERGQKVDSIQRMSATGKEPAPPGASIARVLPGTRDPLGMMQYLRSVDWSATRQVQSPVYDGRKLYDVRAEKTGTAQVSVPAGNFSTTAVEIRVFENGVEMKDAHFTLYLARDATHTPVLLEAVLPFATARVTLVRRTE